MCLVYQPYNSDYSPVVSEVPQEKFLRSSWLALRKSTLVRQRLAEDKAIKTLFAPREITHIFISHDSGHRSQNITYINRRLDTVVAIRPLHTIFWFNVLLKRHTYYCITKLVFKYFNNCISIKCVFFLILYVLS